VEIRAKSDRFRGFLEGVRDPIFPELGRRRKKTLTFSKKYEQDRARWEEQCITLLGSNWGWCYYVS